MTHATAGAPRSPILGWGTAVTLAGYATPPPSAESDGNGSSGPEGADFDD